MWKDNSGDIHFVSCKTKHKTKWKGSGLVQPNTQDVYVELLWNYLAIALSVLSNFL